MIISFFFLIMYRKSAMMIINICDERATDRICGLQNKQNLITVFTYNID